MVLVLILASLVFLFGAESYAPAIHYTHLTRKNSIPLRATKDNVGTTGNGEFVGFKGYEITVSEQHPRTEETALRHFETYGAWQQHHVVAGHTKQAFDEAVAFVQAFYGNGNAPTGDQPVILDSGCGQGLSTLHLARANPTVPVIGIDRSANRLSRDVVGRRERSRSRWNLARAGAREAGGSAAEVAARQDGDVDGDGGDGVENDGEDDDEEDVDDDSGQQGQRGQIDGNSTPFVKSYKSCPNVLFVRAEIADFWLLSALHTPWTIQQHAILYPNPYPKSKHLRRRWHGHPCFPVLLALGGTVRVRSNWKTYCDEMHTAMQACVTAGYVPPYTSLCTGKYAVPSGQPPMTHFEKKYLGAQLVLYETFCEIPPRSPSERLALLSSLAVGWPESAVNL